MPIPARYQAGPHSVPTPAFPADDAATPQPSRPATPRRCRLRAYVALTKPRIIELLLTTTLPTMIDPRGGRLAGLVAGHDHARRWLGCGRTGERLQHVLQP